MTNKTITISVTTIILVVASFIIGFLIGRTSFEQPSSKKITEVKFIKGEVIRDTIDNPVPYEVIKLKEVPVPKDNEELLATWEDYYLLRKYKLDFSQDTIGKFIVDLEVSKNQVQKSSFYSEPLIRYQKETETIYKVPALQFYTMMGTSFDLKVNKIQFGVDLKQKYLIGVSGIRFKDDFSYTADFGIKF